MYHQNRDLFGILQPLACNTYACTFAEKNHPSVSATKILLCGTAKKPSPNKNVIYLSEAYYVECPKKAVTTIWSKGFIEMTN